MAGAHPYNLTQLNYMTLKSLFNKVSNTYLRREIIFAADILLSLAASLIMIFGTAAILNYKFYGPGWLMIYLGTALVASIAMFLITRTPRIIIRHLSVKDFGPFLLASAVKGIAILLAMTLMHFWSKMLLLLVLMDVLLTLLFLVGVRLVMIALYDYLNRKLLERYPKQRILIYSTGDKSVAAVKRLQNSKHYDIKGFIERGSHSKYILEQLPVYAFSNTDDLDRNVRNRDIEAILFAKDTDAQAEEDGLIKYCTGRGIKTLIIPSVDEVEDGQPLLHPREVKLEDLLGRKEIVISMDAIRANMQGKTVLVTGAAGSIGSELVRQLSQFGIKKVILYDNAETPMHNLRLELEDKYPNLNFVPVIGSVRHPERLDYAFRRWRPQIVFHAAAYKHVPLMEENPCEAVLANVYGSRNVAEKCLEYDVDQMVMISTDKAVNPTNIMGCTKRLAEIYVQSLGLAVENGKIKGKTKFVTTRFGNVLGSNGSVIPRFREQIAKGGPVTVTHPDINRFFMTIPEACRLVMEAATMSTGCQIFVFDMGKPVKIDSLARRMIQLAGFTPDKDIKIEYTGLRPGEKLYEEVLANDENTLPAFHERIRIAKVREYPFEEAADYIARLEDLARKVNIPEMVKLMKEIVPEYKSENSEFAALDK